MQNEDDKKTDKLKRYKVTMALTMQDREVYIKLGINEIV